MSVKITKKSDRNVQEQENLNQNQMKELYQQLIRYCHFLSRDKWSGEDLAQESIYKAIKQYGQVPEELNGALLKRIAYNHWVDQSRKMAREVIGEVSEQQIVNRAFHMEATNFLVQDLVQKLTPKQLIVFTLKEAFQYKISEVAHILRMTEPAVKAALKRARVRLKTQFYEDLAPITEVQSQWTKELEEILPEVLAKCLKEQDPTKLIKIIPSLLKPASSEPSLLLQQNKSVQSHSFHNCSLSMAA
ncbi:RNA polymerase sigma-70 factor (ECF subfamily) [Evansella vedderi]|uniref:RNA polymerase sigma-70 factor (ECF subfamily) n=1 Tax=Evansella vedderi TaxID=38282 RepID=A0ABU0A1V1_9BACI|nr:sigma factor-like helix-turn-helix DNA-binding protein [Evansella vedderi]MDQ0256688.1 RNA polymerase sigma-70 factor (ECF subfamily) [Evansella vedderi]